MLIATAAVAGDDLFEPAVWLTYGLFTLGVIWSVGAWLASKSLERRNPEKWSRKKKEHTSEKDWSLYYRRKYGVACLLLAPFMACVLATHHVEHKLELLRLKGVLIPAGDPTPPNQCGGPRDGDVVLLYGDNAALAHSFPHVILRSMTLGPVITLDRLSNGYIAVIMDILDPSGKTVVHMDKEGFKVNPNVIMDRERPDESTLIVTGEYPGDSFRIRYLNKKAIQLDGTFHYPGRREAVPLRIQGCHDVCSKGADNQAGIAADMDIR